MSRPAETQYERDLIIKARQARNKSVEQNRGATKKHAATALRRARNKLDVRGVCLKCEGVER